MISRSAGLAICSTERGGAADSLHLGGSNFNVQARANGDTSNFVSAVHQPSAGKQNVYIASKIGTNLRIYSSDGVSLAYNESTIIANTTPVDTLRFGGLGWSLPADRPGQHTMFLAYKRGLTANEAEIVYRYVKDMEAERGVLVT